MEGKSKLTQEEKRLKRIAQLKAMLQQEEAKQNQEAVSYTHLTLPTIA